MNLKWWMVFLLALLVACEDANEQELSANDLAEIYEEGPPLLSLGGKSDLFSGEILAYGPLPEDVNFDLPLQALFAPDDPVTTLELHMIEQVRNARLADARTFTEGENPYRIRYAVYNLRNPDILHQLARAHKDDVDVQVLIEARQMDPEKPWNIAHTYLAKHGFQVYESHARLSDAQRIQPGTIIGVQGSGLMHLKTRLFYTPESTHLLTGSINPGDNAVFNEETFHLISDDHIIEQYAHTYRAILNGHHLTNQWRESSAINVLFTPVARGMRAGSKIMQWLEDEDEQILLMVFSLRNITADGSDYSLVELLGKKVREGVPVYVITDRKQSDGVDVHGESIGWSDPTKNLLRKQGVPVYEAINAATEFSAMHHKAAILGKTQIRVITDAANWTLAGLGGRGRAARNVESVLFIDSHKLDDNRTGYRYMAQWVRVLERYAEQSVSLRGEAAFEEVFTVLTASPKWPQLDVFFTAKNARTNWGETIYAVGDRPELGSWRNDHDGVPLVTTEESYPTWTAETPVLMPLGVDFEWKFIAEHHDNQTLRWEQGPNREGFVQPGVLQRGNHIEMTGVWP